MAIYHLSAKMGGRSQGRSAVASAAYRSGEKLEDVELGRTFDYTRKQRIEHSEIMAPDHAPDWMQDRQQLWNGVQESETRKNSQFYREIEVALPRELDQGQQVELLRSFVKDEFVDRGMVADVALHSTNNDNPHAHIMLTTRDIEDAGFAKKNREWGEKATLQGWRESWETKANESLEKAGSAARIDHRTLEAQGIERLPTKHLGVAAAALESKGVETARGEENRNVSAINKGYAMLSALKEKGFDKISTAIKERRNSEDDKTRFDKAKELYSRAKTAVQQTPQKFRDWRERVANERQEQRGAEEPIR